MELLRNRNGPRVRCKLQQLDVRLEEKYSFPWSQLRHLIALQTGAAALLHGCLGLSSKKRRAAVPFRGGKRLLGNCRVVASDDAPLDSRLI